MPFDSGRRFIFGANAFRDEDVRDAVSDVARGLHSLPACLYSLMPEGLLFLLAVSQSAHASGVQHLLASP